MRTRAIILKKQNTNEYDQLVTCYTEEFGKMMAVAKSVLKPSSIQAMHLDVFNLVDFELINGRGIPIIAGAQAEVAYTGLKNSLSLSAVACFFAETIDKLCFDYQKDEGLWKFFTVLLAELNYVPVNVGEFLRSKQVEFLDILGYSPNFDECVSCSASVTGRLVAYSIEAKGALCEVCFINGARGVVISRKASQIRSDLRNQVFSGNILGSIFESIAERKIHSLNFLNQVVEVAVAAPPPF